MEVKLVVVSGKANKHNVVLKLPSIVGRSREADVTVAHSLVSRRHCELYEADGLLMVRDLGSLNGTIVEGYRIREAALPPDAELTVGPLTFRAEYEYDGDLDAIPPAELFEQGQEVARPAEPAAPPPISHPQEDDARWGDFVAEMDDEDEDEPVVEAAAPPVNGRRKAKGTGAGPSPIDDIDTEEIEQFTADSLESDLSLETNYPPTPRKKPGRAEAEAVDEEDTASSDEAEAKARDGEAAEEAEADDQAAVPSASPHGAAGNRSSSPMPPLDFGIADDSPPTSPTDDDDELNKFFKGLQ